MNPWFFVLLVLALVFYLLSRSLHRKTGLPGGKVVYSDTHMWGQPVKQPLFDGSLGITGKPDYLVREDDEIIPVEVKSCRTPAAPYDAHIFQVAIYCLLVEKVYQQTPSHGLIHYPGMTYSVEFTPALRQKTLDLLSEMHLQERHQSIPRNHDDPAKCKRCGYRDICDKKLA